MISQQLFDVTQNKNIIFLIQTQINNLYSECIYNIFSKLSFELISHFINNKLFS
jgi:hypothetical protein